MGSEINLGSASGLGGGLCKRGTYHALKWRGGGITEFTGEGSGDQSSPTEYKDCR